jgi:hypothetical protein
MKAGVEKEQIETITDKLYKRRFVEMFDVNFSIKEIKRETAEATAKVTAKETALNIAKSMLKNGEPFEKVATYTGLTREEIENLVA